MKPVPFAQYIARQQQSDSAPAEAPGNTPTWPPRAKTLPGEPPKPSPLLRKIDKEQPDKAEETARRLEQGHLRAFTEGREAARKELEDERSHMREALNGEIAKARAQWAAEEAARLAEAHRAAFDSFEQRCAQAVANILRPFLVQQAIARVTEALVDNLETLFAARAPALFEVSGPADLLDALKEKFAARNARMEFKPDSSIDVRVRVEDTIMETQLGPWLQAIGALARGAAGE